MEFPKLRPRRLRKNENIRRLVRETKLSLDDLIYPIFVRYGEGIVEEVPSMPGVYRYSLDKVVDAVKEVRDLGIPAIILFGIPEHKDEEQRVRYQYLVYWRGMGGLRWKW